jgi:signal transduction histidine kinase
MCPWCALISTNWCMCGNAVKFTPDGGSVRLEVAFHPGAATPSPKAGEVWFTVADTGIGIAPADQERIFEKFAQVDSSSTRRYNGTGLGLAIVREYAEMHGGSVFVTSELGQGATFTVRIPVAGPAREGEDDGDGQAD